MFTLTDGTCIIVKAIAATTSGGRSSGGLRISDGAERGTDFALQPAAGPEDGDIVLEQSGARVFLAPDVADDLAGYVLEASVGRDGVVEFAFGHEEKPEGMTEVRTTGTHAH